jgi:CheY-like chemotaxis protein
LPSRNNLVVFGYKRTSHRIYEYAPQSARASGSGRIVDLGFPATKDSGTHAGARQHDAQQRAPFIKIILLIDRSLVRKFLAFCGSHFLTDTMPFKQISINTEAAMRIMVVDDHDDALDLVQGALLSAGYNDIVAAASSREAFRILDFGRTRTEKTSVDVLLLDIVMPEMDGVQTCARIRSMPHCADLPIIMLTSLDDVDSVVNAFVAGANAYITKPVDRVELVANVRAAPRLRQVKASANSRNWSAERILSKELIEARALIAAHGGENKRQRLVIPGKALRRT